MSGSNIDFTNTLDIQRNYLSDLGVLSSNNVVVTTDLAAIDTKLSNLNTTYDGISTNNSAIQTAQGEMKAIVDAEKARLDEKAGLIDGAYFAKQRAVVLNDSARKRQYNYVYIIYALVIGLIIISAFIFIQSVFPFIPDSVINFIIIIVIGSVVIYSINLLRLASYRDNIYYDKLSVPQPKNLSVNDIAKQQDEAKKKGDLVGSVANPYVCVGGACCSGNSTWDSVANRCIVSCDGGKVDKEGVCVAKTDNNSCVLNDTGTDTGYKVCGNACIKKEATCYETFITLANSEPSEVLPYSSVQSYGRV